MNNAFTRSLSTPTPQTEKANERQIANHAGGFVYQVSDKTRLERFLILGTDGGTYYQGERDLTKQNLDFLKNLIARDEEFVWDTVRDVSVNGRAYKNSPAIFALAYLFKFGKIKDKPQQSFEKTAKKLLPQVCRTGTHLYEWTKYMEYLGGWNRSMRTAVSNWYLEKPLEAVAYQAIKYRQRDGWTHRDEFRLAHPKGVNTSVGAFILGKPHEFADDLPIIDGFKFAQMAKTTKDVLQVLSDCPNLPWEAIPTQFLKDADVWKKLFYNGQLKGQALVRNITRLARIGAFDDMVFARDYATRLTDVEMIQKTRLHPINYLNALVVHQEGQIDRVRSNTMDTYRKDRDWSTVPVIVDALNEGFYKAFKYTEPANKRTLVALDISGSMDSPASGLELSCAQVGAAMAMTIAKTEPYYMVRGFSNAGGGYYHSRATDRTQGLKDLGIAPSMNLADVLRKTQAMTMGSTDCSLPMEWAIKNKAEIDTFVVITDSETYAGARHPDVALRDYRQKSGIDARLIVVGVSATDISIADPNDPGMLDVVGGDANLPRLIADFSAGRL